MSRRLLRSGLITAGLLVVFAPAAQAVTSAYYYGLYAYDGSTVIAELECRWPKSSTCAYSSYNKVSRVDNSPSGDLQRVQGRYIDRRLDSRPVYVRADFYSNTQSCVSGTIGISVSGGTTTSGTGSTSLCTNWVNLNSTRSSPHVSLADRTTFSSFTLEKVFGPAVNAQRAVVRVCENNNLWFTDRCSGTRLLTVNV